MSAPTTRQGKPAKPTAIAGPATVDLTADEKRILAAYRSVPISGNNRETILLVVETYADLCPRDKRPALQLVRGGAS